MKKIIAGLLVGLFTLVSVNVAQAAEDKQPVQKTQPVYYYTQPTTQTFYFYTPFWTMNSTVVVDTTPVVQYRVVEPRQDVVYYNPNPWWGFVYHPTYR